MVSYCVVFTSVICESSEDTLAPPAHAHLALLGLLLLLLGLLLLGLLLLLLAAQLQARHLLLLALAHECLQQM